MPKKKSGKSSMAYYMPVVADRQESIDAKLKKLQGSFFGKPVNKVDVGTLRDVWVPYGYFVYDYEVGGKGLLKAKRSGQVHIICDLNEKHCMQYDEKESGDLPLERKDFAEDDWTIIKSEMSERKATEFVDGVHSDEGHVQDFRAQRDDKACEKYNIPQTCSRNGDSFQRSEQKHQVCIS